MSIQTQPIWQVIRSELTGEIADGLHLPGDKLPTEADLSRRFDVNRHTVRRALAEMAKDGLVYSRRGSGVFVTASPTEYPLGKRVRYHQNLSAAGQMPAKEILQLVTRRPTPTEAEALNVTASASVHCFEALSLGSGVPIALTHSVFPAERFPGLIEAIELSRSVTKALAICGLKDFTRISTRLTAKTASAAQARHLRLTPGAPILRTVSVNADLTGTPIEFGTTHFAGDRVTLTLTDVD
jgi:GntR family phosphonate transport system transcriptional regulator